MKHPKDPLPTNTEAFPHLTITSATPTYRTAEQEWNFEDRNEDCLGPDDAHEVRLAHCRHPKNVY